MDSGWLLKLRTLSEKKLEKYKLILTRPARLHDPPLTLLSLFQPMFLYLSYHAPHPSTPVSAHICVLALPCPTLFYPCFRPCLCTCPTTPHTLLPLFQPIFVYLPYLAPLSSIPVSAHVFVLALPCPTVFCPCFSPCLCTCPTLPHSLLPLFQPMFVYLPYHAPHSSTPVSDHVCVLVLPRPTLFYPCFSSYLCTCPTLPHSLLSLFQPMFVYLPYLAPQSFAPVSAHVCVLALPCPTLFYPCFSPCLCTCPTMPHTLLPLFQPMFVYLPYHAPHSSTPVSAHVGVLALPCPTLFYPCFSPCLCTCPTMPHTLLPLFQPMFLYLPYLAPQSFAPVSAHVCVLALPCPTLFYPCFSPYLCTCPTLPHSLLSLFQPMFLYLPYHAPHSSTPVSAHVCVLALPCPTVFYPCFSPCLCTCPTTPHTIHSRRQTSMKNHMRTYKTRNDAHTLVRCYQVVFRQLSFVKQMLSPLFDFKQAFECEI